MSAMRPQLGQRSGRAPGGMTDGSHGTLAGMRRSYSIAPFSGFCSDPPVPRRVQGNFFSISTRSVRMLYDVPLVGDQPPSATAPRVLIADDNGDSREMYALYLNMVGYRVETAEDGHEAILKARALRPDLVRDGFADAEARWLGRDPGAPESRRDRRHPGHRADRA